MPLGIRSWAGAWDFEAFFFHLRKLNQWQYRLAPFQPPTDTAADARKPSTKGFGMLKRVQIPVSSEERLDQDIFRILAGAANRSIWRYTASLCLFASASKSM